MILDGGVCGYWPQCSIHDGTRYEPARGGLGKKLTPAQVIQIRAQVEAGEMQKVIARQYGIRQQTVSSIVNGRSWRWLDDPRS